MATKTARNKASTSGTKKGSSKMGPVAKTQIRKTAVKMLAGAAAGAVRAIIPPLEEAADTGEKPAGLNKQGGNKAEKSSGKSGGRSSK